MLLMLRAVQLCLVLLLMLYDETKSALNLRGNSHVHSHASNARSTTRGAGSKRRSSRAAQDDDDALDRSSLVADSLRTSTKRILGRAHALEDLVRLLFTSQPQSLAHPNLVRPQKGVGRKLFSPRKRHRRQP